MERYWLIGGAALLGVLLVASVVIGTLRDEQDFDPGTPERAVQQYLQALVNDDFEGAEALWSPELQRECSMERFVWESRRGLDRLADARITLEDVQTIAESTIVTVRVTHTSQGGIFGPSEWRAAYRYAVGLFDGDWRITGHDGPGNGCTRTRLIPYPPEATTPLRRLD